MTTPSNVQDSPKVAPESLENSQSPTPDWPTVQVKPATDIVEYPDHFSLSVAVPGVAHDSLDVTLEKRLLTIDGTARYFAPAGFHPLGGRAAHRRYLRTFQLSDEIDISRIEVELKHGVAWLKLPKNGPAQRVKLTVS